MATPLPANPFMPEAPFVLDVQRFVEAIEPAPRFISDPSPEYIAITVPAPIRELLMKH